jgi:hypothetical protein
MALDADCVARRPEGRADYLRFVTKLCRQEDNIMQTTIGDNF